MTDFKIIEQYVKGKICVLVGTRPGIIKMSPIITELQRRGIDSFVIHAGQHYSYNMDAKFFEDIELNKPKYRLEEVKNCSLHGEQTAEMLRGIERILVEEKPETILVCGDANVNLAGALAARKLRLKVGHVESGLRSNDWTMPEEHNRIMIDHISDYLFVPTDETKQNALEDNVKGEIFVTGNTIVDAVMLGKKRSEKKSSILKQLELEPEGYFVLTVHREENVDVKNCLEGIIGGINLLSEQYSMPIVFPMHPRSKKMIAQFGLESTLQQIEQLRLIEPLGYLDFILLLSSAKCVLTDSGGLQEETCILRVPCVTLRESTERPETIAVKSNITAGTDPNRIVSAVEEMLSRNSDWANPFGDGRAAERIVDIVLRNSGT